MKRSTIIGLFFIVGPDYSRPHAGECVPDAKAVRFSWFSHLKKSALICASVLLQAGTLCAAPVGDIQARLTASTYVGRNYAPSSIAKAAQRLAAPAGLTPGECRPITGAQGTIGFVVGLAPSGFVVVRADDDLPPIKLHSSAGAYEDLPPGFRAVIEAELAGEVSDLAELRSSRGEPDSRFHAAWQALAQTAAPFVGTLSLAPAVETAVAGTTLLTTTWAQTSPYN